MPQFYYDAFGPDGLSVQGDIVSDTKREAVAALRAQGLSPVEIKHSKQRRRFRDITFGSGVKKKDVMLLCRKTASLLRAGVGMADAFTVLIRQEKKPGMRNILTAVLGDILAGRSLSDALSKHKEFSAFVVNMTRVGEQNGRLADSFESVAETLAREVKTEGRLKNAMIYPIVLLAVSFVVIAILVTAVLPVFADTFSKMGAELPPLTSALMGVSEFIRGNALVLLGALAVLVAAIAVLLRTRQGRRLRNRAALIFPVSRGLITNMMMSRFSRCMSVMLRGGVDIITALSITGDVMSNALMQERLAEISAAVESGGSAYSAMRRMKEFTPMVTSVVRVGEETGGLGVVLGECADFYDDETERSLTRLVSLMEPLVTIILAVFIGLVVVSVVQPMFQVYSLIV